MRDARQWTTLMRDARQWTTVDGLSKPPFHARAWRLLTTSKRSVMPN
jgi:hypothetical protein